MTRQIKGCTVAERTPCNQQVAGSNLAGCCWSLFFLIRYFISVFELLGFLCIDLAIMHSHHTSLSGSGARWHRGSVRAFYPAVLGSKSRHPQNLSHEFLEGFVVFTSNSMYSDSEEQLDLGWSKKSCLSKTIKPYFLFATI